MGTRILTRARVSGLFLLVFGCLASCAVFGDLNPFCWLNASDAWAAEPSQNASAKQPTPPTQNASPKIASAPDVPVVDKPLLSGDERIEQKLREVTTVEFVETPLSDVVEFLKGAHDVEIQIDTRALEEVGVGTDQAITLHLKKVMLKSALRHILRRLALVYTIQDEVILITTPEVVESHLQIRVYPVRDLIQYKDERGQLQEDPDELIETIQGLVQPNTWDAVGGPGSIPSYDGMFIISQTQDVHEEIADLLNSIRKLPLINSAEAGQGKEPIRLAPFDPQQEKIDAALDKATRFEFVDLPLNEVVDILAEKHELNILLDRRGLEEIGVAVDSKVTRNVSGLTLRASLKLLLEPLELQSYILDEVLVISGKDSTSLYPITSVYPVLDLLALPEEITRNDVDGEIEMLMGSIQRTIQPNTWSSEGGDGAMKRLFQRGAIIISNTADVHAEIKSLLTDLRVAKEKQPAGPMVAHAAEDELLVIGYELVYDPPGKNEKGEPTGPEPEHFDTKELAEMIRTVVAPESWAENKQAYINSLTDRLLVRQEKRVHREIEVLFQQLGVNYISGARGDSALSRRAGSRFLNPRLKRQATGGGLFNLPSK